MREGITLLGCLGDRWRCIKQAVTASSKGLALTRTCMWKCNKKKLIYFTVIMEEVQSASRCSIHFFLNVWSNGELCLLRIFSTWLNSSLPNRRYVYLESILRAHLQTLSKRVKLLVGVVASADYSKVLSSRKHENATKPPAYTIITFCKPDALPHTTHLTRLVGLQ